MRVVLIDDGLVNLQVLQMHLHNIDPTITILTTFNRQADVLAELKNWSPDVVFTNIEMDEGTAFQFLEAYAPYVFDVVFVTAKPKDYFGKKARSIGAFDYLLKPIDPLELGETIGKLRKKYPN
jgi:two-component SAPR family response regulator